MIISLDLESSVPIYEQIHDCILRNIAAKNLQSGDLLPSVRSLAVDLGVNLHTVNKAYSLLKSSGYVAVHKRLGVFIRDTKDREASELQLSLMKEKIENIAAEAAARNMDIKELLAITKESFAIVTNGDNK